MRNVFPTQIYRNKNKHCNGERERERQKGEWKRRPKMRLGPERYTQIGLQFQIQTHVGCAQTYTLTVQHTDTYLYPYLSLSLSREESKNANTRPAAVAKVKIKNCAAKNKNVDGGGDSRNWKKTNKKFKAAPSQRKYPSDTIYIYLSIWLFVNAKVSDWDVRLWNQMTAYRRDLWQKSETHRKFSSIFTF